MKVRAEVDIAASDHEVWTVLADIASWPTWNPAIRYAVRDEQLEVGTRFRFSTEMGTLKCRVTQVDAPNLLSWKGRLLLLGERQTWRLEPRADGTHVTVEAEMTGPFAFVFRRRLDERLQRVLDAVVQLLRLEAEVRSVEEREHARPEAKQGRAEDHV